MAEIDLRYQLERIQNGPGGTMHVSLTPVEHPHFGEGQPTNGRLELFVSSEESQALFTSAQLFSVFTVTLAPEAAPEGQDERQQYEQQRLEQRNQGPSRHIAGEKAQTGNYTWNEGVNDSPYRNVPEGAESHPSSPVNMGTVPPDYQETPDQAEQREGAETPSPETARSMSGQEGYAYGDQSGEPPPMEDRANLEQPQEEAAEQDPNLSDDERKTRKKGGRKSE